MGKLTKGSYKPQGVRLQYHWHGQIKRQTMDQKDILKGFIKINTRQIFLSGNLLIEINTRKEEVEITVLIAMCQNNQVLILQSEARN